MGELGSIRRYPYWAERRIQQLASDNGISLRRRTSWKAKSAAVPFLPSFEWAQEACALDRSRVADRIETAIGARAVTDFVTPPPVEFAKGVGRVEFAQLGGVRQPRDQVVLHTTVHGRAGTRVEVCLFGSLANAADYVGGADTPPEGWTSSAARSVEELIRSRGTVNNSQWDKEALAVEALVIATEQGVTGTWAEHEHRPWTRGFTLGRAEESEWLAVIYADVVLDKHRWKFGEGGIPADVDRILVGAPLWVRSPSPQAMTRYHARR
ncbi:hypothetical protein [Amycolatopsis sp. CA-230715]|uniref:hypothetical protein n=1 Tax=Amycolatopsis sp. CA-230715 TaxID=2745196 RepID=UPI001C00D830|nr:hypothetical protein [Amycolatopsis sp. CA-230715]QWF85614.1 hypothetical protein HUW46_09069 [Amycolatopsis sp. CA-230715]